jgi:chromosome segregation ATPase
MPDDPVMDRSAGVLETLFAPLRLPQRAVTEIETIARTVQVLSGTASEHLRSIDDRAATLVRGIAGMRASMSRLEDKVTELAGLEATIEERMEALREDLNTRMLAVEQHLRAVQPKIDQIARDVGKIDQLLPDPDAGPLARLKDTLTSS